MGKKATPADSSVDALLEGKAPAAKKAAKKGKKAAAEEAPSGRKPRVAMKFEAGERQEMYDAIASHFKRSKKAISSKDLATKLDKPMRKVRSCLYAMSKKEDAILSLSLDSSRVAGMTVTPN